MTDPSVLDEIRAQAIAALDTMPNDTKGADFAWQIEHALIAHGNALEYGDEDGAIEALDQMLEVLLVEDRFRPANGPWLSALKAYYRAADGAEAESVAELDEVDDVVKMNRAEALSEVRSAHDELWYRGAAIATAIELAATDARDAWLDPNVGLTVALVCAELIRATESVREAEDQLRRRSRGRKRAISDYLARSALMRARNHLDVMLQEAASCPAASEIINSVGAGDIAPTPVMWLNRVDSIIAGMSEMIDATAELMGEASVPVS